MSLNGNANQGGHGFSRVPKQVPTKEALKVKATQRKKGPIASFGGKV